MSCKVLYGATDYFTPFPDPKAVFSRDVKSHCQYLLPLATIDLSVIDPILKGKVHFIQPIEPWAGVVGEGGDEFFTYYCRENYVGYTYDESGLCQLGTDFGFFELARSSNEQLSKHYENVRMGFEKAHDCYRRNGWVCYEQDEPAKSREHFELISEIGPPSEGGNWPETVEFPMHWGTLQINGEETDHIVPLTEDGRSFLYVGTLSAFCWLLPETSALGCDLLLFYDPVTRTALTTFDWS